MHLSYTQPLRKPEVSKIYKIIRNMTKALMSLRLLKIRANTEAMVKVYGLKVKWFSSCR